MVSRFEELGFNRSVARPVLFTIAAATAILFGVLTASAGATETDKTPPVVTLSGTAVKAVEEGKTTGTYELQIVATDGSKTAPQSGVAKIEVGVDGSGQQSWEKSCPEGSCGLEEKWTYSPASYLSESPRWITVEVTDHAGNVTEEEISIEGIEEVREAAPTGPDTTAPTITFLGSAVEAVETGATTGKYELRMLARDGSASGPQSGVSKIEVAVDGTTVQSWEKYCPIGSCRLKIQWPYTPASFTGTGHVLTVTVRDHAGNVTTRTIGPDTTPPVIELSGALTEGIKTGTTSYPLHVHATDGSAEFPGSGVKSITISVDGTAVKSAEQPCPAGDCELSLEWIYETAKYLGEHEVTVAATDQAGNQVSRAIELGVSDGAIPACLPLNKETPSTPSETAALEGGGKLEIYKTEGDGYYEFPIPPKTFKPLTASSAELEEYGFPARPGVLETQRLERWERLMKGYSGTATGGICDASGSRVATVEELAEGANYTAANYSGFEAEETPGKGLYKGIEATNEAAALNPGACTDDSIDQWVGLGGHGHGLIQGGVKVNVEGQYHLFVNTLKSGLERPDHVVSGVHVGHNNSVYTQVEWYPGSETGRVYFQNESTGEQKTVMLTKINSSFYDGAWADFIDERPHKTGKPQSDYFNLYDYNGDAWKGTEVESTTVGWKALGEFKRRKLNMTEKGTILSEAGGLQPNGLEFADHWKKCHG